MGARLLHFWKQWEARLVEPWVLRVLKEGYAIPFKETPPLLSVPIALKAYSVGSEMFSALSKEVTVLLYKRAIEEVEDLSLEGFYNRLFVVPKTSKGWRPVLDVSALNFFVQTMKFRMQTNSSVLSAISQEDWMVLIDMKDAYFHIPIYRDSRKFLRFVFQDKVFQFRALCFGLSTAPQVFTRVLAPLS